MALWSAAAAAEPAGGGGAIAELRTLVEQQREALERQQAELDRQRQRLEELEGGVIAGERGRGPAPPGGAPPVNVTGNGTGNVTAPTEATSGAAPETSVERPPPEIPGVTRQAGVLTPKGSFVVEPALDYAKSTSVRLTFRGAQIIPAVLIGALEASDVDRDILTASVAGRYGITDRLEAEVKVPFVYRDDRVSTFLPGQSAQAARSDEFDGYGLGDVEATLRYQVNHGLDGWPIFVGNLGLKTATGLGPFDAKRDPDTGQLTQAPTGSGFYAVSPSVNVLYPLDPAVLFAKLGYVYNVPENVDTVVAGQRIGDVSPGGSISLGFGIGVALNERLSLNFSYAHDFVGRTTTEVTPLSGPTAGQKQTLESNTLSVGTFQFGAALQLNDRMSASLSSAIGVTDDAPNVELVLRLPIRF